MIPVHELLLARLADAFKLLNGFGHASASFGCICGLSDPVYKHFLF